MMEAGSSLLNVLSSAIGGFLSLRTDGLKNKVIESLSVGFSRVLSMLVILMLLLIVLAVFAFAFVLLIGEAIGSLWGAAFIVGGVYLIALLIVFFLRKQLFLSVFMGLFEGIVEDGTDGSDFKSASLMLVRYLRESLDI